MVMKFVIVVDGIAFGTFDTEDAAEQWARVNFEIGSCHEFAIHQFLEVKK
jgi:hypothetical protein